MRKVALGLVLLSSGLGPLQVRAGSHADKSVVHTVRIHDMKFDPETIVINEGDQVIWANEDIVPHTVTGKDVFDSGAVESGKSFRRNFPHAAMLRYTCSFHPTMTGRIEVRSRKGR